MRRRIIYEGESIDEDFPNGARPEVPELKEVDDNAEDCITVDHT
jgi:hypothetical protein